MCSYNGVYYTWINRGYSMTGFGDGWGKANDKRAAFHIVLSAP